MLKVLTIKEEILNRYCDEDLLIADGFDDAIIGIEENTMRIIYSISKCIPSTYPAFHYVLHQDHSEAPNGSGLTNICSYGISSWLAKNMNRSILHFVIFFHNYYKLL